MSWKNWGDHPIAVVISVASGLVGIIGFGFFVYDRYPKSNEIMGVSLLSDRGIDYLSLRELLKENKWKEANNETLRLILKLTDREKEGFVSTTLMRQFPCKDLLTIENLWLTASKGRFGFRVQQGIWKRFGGPGYSMGEKPNLLKRFYEEIEWNKDIKFSLDAPVGHLPVFSNGAKIGGISNTYRVIECESSK
jgi:GUN4-like